MMGKTYIAAMVLAGCRFYIMLLCLLFAGTACIAQVTYAVDTFFHDDGSCTKKAEGAYFQVRGKYPDRSDNLVRQANKALEKISAPGINGYITYRMRIGCKGVPVAYELLQNDMDYRPAQFPKELVDGLYDFVRSLKGWRIATYEKEPVMYRVYLSFKIRNGHVVQVSP